MLRKIPKIKINKVINSKLLKSGNHKHKIIQWIIKALKILLKTYFNNKVT